MKNKEVEQHHLEMQESLNKFLLENGHPIEDFKIVAVGYLGTAEEFERGEVSKEFLLKLRAIWNEGPILASMGHHTCEFCGKATSSCEKILRDRENRIEYIFPEMIFHYIEKHRYCPPNDFIKFIMEHS